ncbi:hypothetical protein [Trichormus sp. NMC-1]|nr:hypothetical protein [Trichormus sp. NMC-1]
MIGIDTEDSSSGEIVAPMTSEASTQTQAPNSLSVSEATLP